MSCAIQKPLEGDARIDTPGGCFYIENMTLLGKVLEEKYEVLALIGEGGMGAVYKGVHRAIGRPVAIKVLHARFADNLQAVQRFHREAQIAGSLGHGNICDVMDIGKTAQGVPFMVMPLLEGRSLAEELEAEGPLSPARALDVMGQILSALAVAHEAGIVHRDLKPENIFLTRMGDRGDFVKILDFGISKMISAAGPEVGSLTSTGMVMGTPYYMSPEQAQGAKQVDQRTDIYAVGVLLYYLLTGAHPFEADSYNELIVKIATEPFPAPRQINSAIPAAVERVIIKAMEKNPQARFADAVAFKEALITQARDSGLSAPGTASAAVAANRAKLASQSAGESLQRLSAADPNGGPIRVNTADDLVIAGGRRWLLPVVGLGVMVIVVAGLVWFARTGARSPTESATPQKSGRRPRGRPEKNRPKDVLKRATPQVGARGGRPPEPMAAAQRSVARSDEAAADGGAAFARTATEAMRGSRAARVDRTRQLPARLSHRRRPARRRRTRRTRRVRRSRKTRRFRGQRAIHGPRGTVLDTDYDG